MTDNKGLTFGIFALAIAALALGFSIGRITTLADKHSKEATSPKTSQWIGRFVAGNGDGRIFSAPMIELGLRSDGVIAWRTKQPEPFSLISTQQTEAK